MTPEKECPVCHGNRWVLEEAEGSMRARRCDCQAARRVQVLIDQARIPRRFRGCTLDNFEEHTETQKNAKKISQKVIENYPVQETGLLFIGDCGVGKTHLAVSIIKELIIRRGAQCIFYDFRQLTRDLYQSIGSESRAFEGDIINPVIQSEVLVLDELGAKQDTPWIEDIIYHIITSRYNNKTLTIFTSNYPDQPEEEEPHQIGTNSGKPFRKSETLEDRIGTRIYSKINEMCMIVRIYANDYRKTIRQPGTFK